MALLLVVAIAGADSGVHRDRLHDSGGGPDTDLVKAGFGHGPQGKLFHTITVRGTVANPSGALASARMPLLFIDVPGKSFGNGCDYDVQPAFPLASGAMTKTGVYRCGRHGKRVGKAWITKVAPNRLRFAFRLAAIGYPRRYGWAFELASENNADRLPHSGFLVHELEYPSRGQIGGPPTIPLLGPADEGRMTTPALVIGRGKTYDGRVEIAAYGWSSPDNVGPSPRHEFCTWIEYPPYEINFGTCGSALDQLSGGAIEIDDVTQLVTPKRRRYTEIGGRLTSNVASVRVSYRRHGQGRRLRVNATVAQVRGQLQTRLKQPAPFGYFDVKVRGLVGFRAPRARAFDASGRFLGSMRGD